MRCMAMRCLDRLGRGIRESDRFGDGREKIRHALALDVPLRILVSRVGTEVVWRILSWVRVPVFLYGANRVTIGILYVFSPTIVIATDGAGFSTIVTEELYPTSTNVSLKCH